MLQTTKAFSKSLKKIINKANPEQRDLTLYLQRSHSTHSSLPRTGPAIINARNRANSQKMKTQPIQQQTNETQMDLMLPLLPSGDKKQSTFSDRVDDIMYGLIERGEARVDNLKGIRECFQKKRLKNLRVVTEQFDPRPSHKRSQAHEELEMLIIRKEVSRERLLRKKFLYENPQVEKKVSTRWEKEMSRGNSKEMLSYYPLVDMRQENQELMMNMPSRSEDFLRKLRQTALNKLKH